MKKIIFVIVASLVFLPTKAQNPDSLAVGEAVEMTEQTSDAQLWAQGNQAYVSGDYAQAKECYKKILDGGRFSVKLYNNLGSACFKTGNIGQAILYFNRALMLSPSNADLRFNLQMAESQTKDKIAQVPEVFFIRWMRSFKQLLSCSGWSILSLVLFAMAMSAFLCYLLSQRLSVRKFGFYGFVLSFVFFIAAILFAVSSGNDIAERNRAVVMSTAISVKSTPDNSSKDLFVIHEGTVVTLTGSIDEWYEIVLSDGKKGWIESKSIEII